MTQTAGRGANIVPLSEASTTAQVTDRYRDLIVEAANALEGSGRDLNQTLAPNPDDRLPPIEQLPLLTAATGTEVVWPYMTAGEEEGRPYIYWHQYAIVGEGQTNTFGEDLIRPHSKNHLLALTAGSPSAILTLLKNLRAANDWAIARKHHREAMSSLIARERTEAERIRIQTLLREEEGALRELEAELGFGTLAGAFPLRDDEEDVPF